ncbi:MAG: phospholipase [Bacteroidaceae bacterium]|nr:phospholipase [Bacteroidaceae bacterium]
MGMLCCSVVAKPTAKGHMLKAYRGEIPQGYNFWIYTPLGYDTITRPVPVVIFLHGASLCGRNLERVRRYGPLDAVAKGREIPAVIIAPQNPGGPWVPQKIIDILSWTEQHFNVDSTRVYAIGMSLGGYGTLDLVGTFPEKIAAGMALCGGCTLKDQNRLGELPLWIMHGTADRAIPVRYSKVVVEGMISRHQALRLRYDWLPGASHGALARIFYLPEAYQWLFSHTLTDENRPVSREIDITLQTMSHAYKDLTNRGTTLTVVP